MVKKSFALFLGFTLVVFLAACAANSQSGSAQSTGQPSQNTGSLDPSKMTTEEKLAIGTLKLEGTNQAVTAAEAKQLLPLWKAVKSLTSSSTASQAEIQALYKQIPETMTADQVKAINNMSFTSTDLQTVMKDLGIQPGPVMSGTPGAGISQSAQATRAAQSQNSGGPGGMPGGMPPGDMGGALPGQSQGSAQQTPVAGQSSNRPAGGMDTLLVNAVIQLLQTRASS